MLKWIIKYCECMGWFHSSSNRVQWRTVLEDAKECLGSVKSEELLIS